MHLKKFIFILSIALFSLSFVSVTQAGFLDKMKDKAVKKVKQETEKNIENEIDKKIEELIPSFDKSEKPQMIQADAKFNAKPDAGVVAIYTTQTCPYCKKAIQWLNDNKVPYNEYDVRNHPKGKLDYKILGGRGVPLILVGDERMNGFSAANLTNMLKRDEEKRSIEALKNQPQKNSEAL